jgi:hypothetical protein
MREGILNFEVLFYSANGQISSVLDFLQSLIKSNKEMSIKATKALLRLPAKIYDGQDIKPLLMIIKSFGSSE